MKRKGILITGLVLGMTISVSAVTHQAISAHIKSQAVNYKGNTKSQQVITYNDTIYVPLRSFSELVGMPVAYQNGTVYLGNTTGTTGTTDTSGTTYIGETKAKNIALQHAGVKAEQVSMKQLKLDREDHRVVYEIEFYVGNKEYDYEIDAITGVILSYDYDIEGFEIPNINNNGNYIGKDKAEQIALKHAKLTKEQVKFIQSELDEDDGRWEYDVEFKFGNKSYEYEINAYTGEVISFDVEND